MDYPKIGALIRTLRLQQHLTQRALAQKLNVSDKTVSKWERGQGCPDVSLLPALSDFLGVEAGVLLSGELDPNDAVGGNMKNLKFYVCPHCGNLLTSSNDASLSCCGKKLSPLTPQKAGDLERLSVSVIENDYYVSSSHPMQKDHYIAFLALLTGDGVVIRRQYPEWDLSARLPRTGHGKLLFYCTRHGLFYQLV